MPSHPEKNEVTASAPLGISDYYDRVLFALRGGFWLEETWQHGESSASSSRMNIEPGGQHEPRWWLAINGPSCAPSPYPLPATLKVVPTPELLLGFQTQEEQLKNCDFILTRPIAEVRQRLREIQKDKSILRIVPEDGAQQPSAQTVWLPKG